jgi:peptidoglycan/LPS O-acetylase OafA/YrhL
MKRLSDCCVDRNNNFNLLRLIGGFLVSQSFVNRPHVVEFLVARVLRIFPGLVVALVFTVLLGAWVTTLPLRDYVSDPRVHDYFPHNAVLDLRWGLPGVFLDSLFPQVVSGSLWTLPKEFALYMMTAPVAKVQA